MLGCFSFYREKKPPHSLKTTDFYHPMRHISWLLFQKALSTPHPPPPKADFTPNPQLAFVLRLLTSCANPDAVWAKLYTFLLCPPLHFTGLVTIPEPNTSKTNQKKKKNIWNIVKNLSCAIIWLCVVYSKQLKCTNVMFSFFFFFTECEWMLLLLWSPFKPLKQSRGSFLLFIITHQVHIHNKSEAIQMCGI